MIRPQIAVQRLSEEAFRPFGWVLGKASWRIGGEFAFHDANIDFWEEDIFDAGEGGETHILRVNYRNTSREVKSLEMHRLTYQMLTPLTGAIVQIVAEPDLARLQAFRMGVGEGICMRPGCWHATRVDEQEVQCLMLTRRSTTVDLINHLKSGSELRESAIVEIPEAVIAF